jgi:hypothetical protein
LTHVRKTFGLIGRFTTLLECRKCEGCKQGDNRDNYKQLDKSETGCISFVYAQKKMLWLGLRRFLGMIIYDFALEKHLRWRRWGECESEYDPSKNGPLSQMGGG